MNRTGRVDNWRYYDLRGFATRATKAAEVKRAGLNALVAMLAASGATRKNGD